MMDNDGFKLNQLNNQIFNIMQHRKLDLEIIESMTTAFKLK